MEAKQLQQMTFAFADDMLLSTMLKNVTSEALTN
jgi:hypothetical protein